MHEYSIKEVIEVCEKKKLKPGKVKGTDSVLFFIKAETERLETIDWGTFENILSSKNLTVYGTDNGWMKIFDRKSVNK